MGLIVMGFLLHLVFILSIFDIYFTSPIIHGMTPHKSRENPPAKRLVLFSADGLRAESLYGDSISAFPHTERYSPYLRSLVENKRAAWGLSHTRVPTESRPGHVALTSGFYEDPSAIAKGWKENPVQFDSIFNESGISWAWGSPDIIKLFDKSNNVHGYYYKEEDEDFSGKSATTLLDTWVFDKVTEFFKNNPYNKKFDLHQDKAIFFLHLLGLDTAGHTHKPNSPELIENIRVVDAGVQHIEKLFHDFYGDNLTAFVFTSDHGMTDWGSHGAGSKFETETPFILWGAGIAPSKDPLEIKQADIAPLVSTLIGTPIPVNSIGTLPIEVLSMSEKDIANALFANARQIFAQYDERRRRTEENSMSLLYKPFPTFSTSDFHKMLTSIESQISSKSYQGAIMSCLGLIELALTGLDYYHNYYQRPLLFAISLTYLEWIALLLISLYEPTKDKRGFFISKSQVRDFVDCIKDNKILDICYLIIILCMVVTTILLFVQSLPFMYYFYCNIPFYLLIQIISKHHIWFPKFQLLYFEKLLYFQILGLIILFLIGIQTLVMCFFERWYLSIILIIMSSWAFFLDKINWSIKISWNITCLFLAIFPFLPVVGSTFNYILISSAAVLWILANFGLVFLPKIVDKNLQINHVERKYVYVAIIQSSLITIAVCNQFIVDKNIRSKIGLTFTCQLVSCLLTVISLIIQFCGSDLILGRLVNIMMSFLIPFLLLSVSYEPLFMLALFLNLILWLVIEHNEYGPLRRNQIATLFFNPRNQPKILFLQRSAINVHDFRRAFFILTFSVLAFFGMGNMASLNSFDPMWVRNFLTVFSPFTMAALILFKILIPYIIVSCVFRAVTTCLLAPVAKIFGIVLIFCDSMGLCFLYYVRNTGSWLEIGSSISHFIIVQTMVLFLLLLYAVAVTLTDFSFIKHTQFGRHAWKVHRR